MLGTDDDGVYALGDALIAILYGHLALGIGAQVGHYLSFFADSS